ncbi:aldo/keto reductase [Enterococcus sp. BWR-S5]|uniref:aldo/keto reductase n=1 Tax=Enterococcus sp. BWR-S5 TaxID=2787714 RepID=UPI0019225E7C|nr:aldo/keto reductase [Enterococcus sp. BWR-S5]MBL1226025.1 aldo/keto reductase [Enterococcus sp. BWR-S5]
MFTANEQRYDTVDYRRSGKSGVLLPPVSLGLWRGHALSTHEKTRELVLAAFDKGVIHFDLANNYGLTPGDSEKVFGKIMTEELAAYRDELIISTKAGFLMGPGPYGEWGSKKYITSSLDNSLKRMNLDYVDIFYTHRPDPNTPFEETAEALDLIVRQGKAYYIGISNYNTAETMEMIRLFKERRTPFVIHQMSYNMLNREPRDSGLLELLDESGIGGIAYGPLAEGLLTDKFSQHIPEDFPIHRTNKQLLAGSAREVTQRRLEQLRKVAEQRRQSLSQMALAWLLAQKEITSVVVGATQLHHFEDNLEALDNLHFSEEEVLAIDSILND